MLCSDTPFLGRYENSSVYTGIIFSAIVSALKLGAFPCFPQVDHIFCVDHRGSHYLPKERTVQVSLKIFHDSSRSWTGQGAEQLSVVGPALRWTGHLLRFLPASVVLGFCGDLVLRPGEKVE